MAFSRVFPLGSLFCFFKFAYLVVFLGEQGMRKSFLGFKSVGHLARLAVIAASIFGLVGVSTRESQAQAKLLRVRGTLQHVHGANIGWVVNSGGSNYGHDLGPNNFTGYGYNYVGANMDSYFGDIKNMHTS